MQKDKQVWNYITRDKAKEIAEGMYDSNNAVTSRLCSSYAWDTALKFIETKNAGYATNSSQGSNVLIPITNMIITAIAMITANTFFRFNLDSVSYRLPSTHKFPPKVYFYLSTISFLC